MKIKQKLLMIGAALCLPVIAHAAPLPSHTCTGLTDMERVDPQDASVGCKIIATTADANSAVVFGEIHARIYKPAGTTLNNSSGQAVLDKLIIWVNGYAPRDAQDSLSPIASYDPWSTVTPAVTGLDAVQAAEGATIIALKQQIHGDDSIQDNAYAVQAALEFLKSYRNDRPIVVIGYSTGGLMARYALADLEDKGIAHNTSLFISFDVPYQGVMIPQSIQNLFLSIEQYATDLDSFAMNSIPANIDATVRPFVENVLQPEAQQLAAAIQNQTDAISSRTLFGKFGEQMVRYHVNGAAEHAAWMADAGSIGPNSNGYPQNSNNIALINGTLGDANGAILQPPLTFIEGNKWFELLGRAGDITPPNEGYAFAKFELFASEPNMLSAQSTVGVFGTYTYTAPCFFFFTCTYTGASAAKVEKPIISGNTFPVAEATQTIDNVQGSWINWGEQLNSAFQIVSTPAYADFTFTDTNNLFVAVPSHSGLDVSASAFADANRLFNAADTPFSEIHSTSPITTFSYPHLYVNVSQLSTQIADALFTLVPPATVADVFSAPAVLNPQGNLTGNYNVLAGNVCSAIDKAASGKGNALSQANQRLNQALAQATNLLAAGDITQSEHDDIVAWLDLLIDTLNDSSTVLADWAVEATDALVGTSLEC